MSMSGTTEKSTDYLAIGCVLVAFILLPLVGYLFIRSIDKALIIKPVRILHELYEEVDQLRKGHEGVGRKKRDLEKEEMTHSRSLLVLGHRLYNKQRYGEALEAYDQAIQMEPDQPEPYYWRGRVYISTGETDRAFNDFKKAVELNPSYGEALDNLGWLCTEIGKYEEGAQYLSRSISLKPDNAWAYYQRGHCYFKLGDQQAALEDAKMACELGFRDGCTIYRKFSMER
jgi:tetratricopeptide (TPR) repeat protein